jgi:hypothetical protein
MRLRLSEHYSEESIAELPDEMRRLVMDAEAEVEIEPFTFGARAMSLGYRVRGNAAWDELSRLILAFRG